MFASTCRKLVLPTTKRMLSCCNLTGGQVQSPIASAQGDSERVAVELAPPAGRAAPVLAGFKAAGLLSSLPRHGLAMFNITPKKSICVVTRNGALEGAIHNVCPHKEANLALGDIEEAHGSCAVKCPRHRKKFPGGLNFDVHTGRSWTGPGAASSHPEYDPTWSVPVYDTRVVADGAGHKWVMISEVPTVGVLPKQPSGLAKGKAISAALDNEIERMGSTGSIAFPGTSVAVKEAGEKAAVLALQLLRAESQGLPQGVPAGASKPYLPPPGLAKTLSVHVNQRHSSGAGRQWTSTMVQEVRRESHDTLLFVLQAESASCSDAGVAHAVDPHSWHVSLALAPPPSTSREYTPLSSLAEWRREGRMELLIKIYPNGRLTGDLGSIQPGACMFVSEPETTLCTPALLPPGQEGEFGPAMLAKDSSGSLDVEYIHSAPGEQGVPRAPAPPHESAPPTPLAMVAAATAPVGQGSVLVLIAGGTGITPMLQLVRWALEGEAPPGSVPSRVILLCSHKSGRDILVRDELARLARQYSGVFTLQYTVTQEVRPPQPTADEAAAGVTFACGRISAALLSSLLPNRVHRVVVSGPAGMFECVRSAIVSLSGGAMYEEVLIELEA